MSFGFRKPQKAEQKGYKPTGIKSLDKLMTMKTNRIQVRLWNGKTTWIAPGQYVKGVVGPV